MESFAQINWLATRHGNVTLTGIRATYRYEGIVTLTGKDAVNLVLPNIRHT